MGYSNDLRVRVIQVVEGGAAARAAARQFPLGEALAGDRKLQGQIQQGPKPVAVEEATRSESTRLLRSV